MGKEAKNQKPKKKKEKIIYVDDGSTIADMSGVGRGKSRSGGNRAGKPDHSNQSKHVSAPLREQWRTYVNAVKLMFFPMLVVLGIIAVAFLIVYILL